jgi:hypothetical protein
VKAASVRAISKRTLAVALGLYLEFDAPYVLEPADADSDLL